MAGKGKGNRDKMAADLRPMKALTHPLRIKILEILSERMASPNELSKELREPLGNVSYHVKTLLKFDCIELIKTEPRRGAVEHYYRATTKGFLADRDWADVPDSVKPGLSTNLLKQVIGDATTALDAGTFDARKDRHCSRTVLAVDEKGWGEVGDVLRRAEKELAEIKARNAKRLEKSGDGGITTSVALLGFEMPETNGKKKSGGKG